MSCCAALPFVRRTTRLFFTGLWERARFVAAYSVSWPRVPDLSACCICLRQSILLIYIALQFTETLKKQSRQQAEEYERLARELNKYTGGSAGKKD